MHTRRAVKITREKTQTAFHNADFLPYITLYKSLLLCQLYSAITRLLLLFLVFYPFS